MRASSVVVAAALATASGCSFITVRGPPRDRPPGAVPDCTTAPVAPAVDLALTGLALFGALVAHQRLDEPEGGEFPNNDFLRMQRTFSILGVVLEGASTVYGAVKITQCRSELAARRTMSPGAQGEPASR